MKNLILPLMASVVLLVSCSKDDDSSNNPKLYKTVESYEGYNYINNKKVKTLVTDVLNFTFGKNGYVSSRSSETKTIYKLDSKDSVSIYKHKMVYIYNNKNQLIQSKFYENNKNEAETFYKYDTKGNLIEEKEGDEYNGTSFYEYKNGILVKSTRKFENSEMNEITSYEYSNNVLKETYENNKSYKLTHFDNKKNPYYLLMPEAFMKSIPTFASKHNVIKTERFNDKNEKDTDNYSSSFKYNSDGYPTEEISTTGGEEHKRVTKTTYFYK